MKRSFLTTLVVLGALVAVIVVLAATPLGLGIAARFLDRTVERSTGLDLELGALSGNLLSAVSLTDVRLSVRGGPTVLSADRVSVTHDLSSTVATRTYEPAVLVEGASVLIETGSDGRLVGWSDAFAPRDTTAPVKRSSPLTYNVHFSLRGSSIAVRDTAAGFVADVLDLEAWGEASEDAFEVALGGSIAVSARGLARPVAGRFSAEAERTAEHVWIGPASARSRGLELSAFGEVVLPPGGASDRGAAAGRPQVALDALASLDLAELLSLIEAAGDAPPEVEGEVRMEARVSGTLDSLAYRASARAEALTFAGLSASEVAVDVSGDRRAFDVTRVSAGLLGGVLEGSGRVDLAEAAAVGGTPLFFVRADVEKIDLSRVPIPRSGDDGRDPPRLSGVLSASAEASGGRDGINGISGAFGSRVADLAYGAVELGGLELRGSYAGGEILAAGVCCSTRFDASATLGDETVTGRFSLDFRDLAVLGGALGAPELAGTAAASGSIVGTPAAPSFEVEAELPDVAYGGVMLGPSTAHITGTADTLNASWTAFGGAMTGQGRLVGDGRYRAAFQLDDLDLASLVPDSLRQKLGLEGSVSARADVSGDSTSVRLVDGVVSGLSLGMNGHSALLDEPFRFLLTPDSLSVTWMSLTSDLGRLSVAGDLGPAGSGRVSARFLDLDLGGLSRLAPGGAGVQIDGTLRGSADFTGSLRSPALAARLSVDDFSAAGLDFASLAMDVESDTTDVVFDVSAASSISGSVAAYGSVPVVRDSTTLWALDAEREFGVSVLCDGLAVDISALLSPAVKGAGLLSANGSVLLSGRVDSLGSLNGRGCFDELSATFDLVKFATTDTLVFEIGGGGVEFDGVRMGVTRRRVFGDEVGGTVELAGAVRRGGALDVGLAVRGLEVGQILRTLSQGREIPFAGELDADVRVVGTASDPVVDFAARVADPVVYDVAFGAAEASGRYEGGTLTLAAAELRAGGRAITTTGAVMIARSKDSSDNAPPAPELDLRVSAVGFDLRHLRPRRSDLERLGGVIDADLRVLGRATAPRFEGTFSLRDGRLQGLGLSEPVRAVTLQAAAQDGTIMLRRGRARLGGGAIDAVGFVAMAPDAEPTFWLRTKLESPEIAVEGSFDARLGGSAVWAGSAGRSRISGAVSVEKARVTYDVGVLDALRRRPTRVVITRAHDPMANVELDLDVEIDDRVEVRNNVADLDLRGGFHVGGTLDAAEASGSIYAEGGSFHYLDNEFELEALNVAFIDPRRRDPYVDLLGTTSVTDRAGEIYVVTVTFQGFLYDAVPVLSSTPPLSEPDIVALLTFGDTVGWLVAGDRSSGSSGDRFVGLARRAFVSSVFGVAEGTLERLLHLDTVAVDDEAVLAGDLAGADVTLGKEFGDRLRVNYTTAVGRFSDRRVEVGFQLTRRFSLETRADPQGNHAIDLRLVLPFR